jgi:hypothetical protein
VSNAELKVTSGVEKSDCDRVSHMQFNVVHKEMSLTFDDVADFVRACARVPVKRPITPETQFERDLGITGDDGSELLEAAEKRFAVNLAPDQGGYRQHLASALMNTSSMRREPDSVLLRSLSSQVVQSAHLRLANSIKH